MGPVLGIVNRCIATHLIKESGISCTTARTGAVRLIQCVGSALNLKPSARFRWVKAPTSAELTRLTHTLIYLRGAESVDRVNDRF